MAGSINLSCKLSSISMSDSTHLNAPKLGAHWKYGKGIGPPAKFIENVQEQSASPKLAAATSSKGVPRALHTLMHIYRAGKDLDCKEISI